MAGRWRAAKWGSLWLVLALAAARSGPEQVYDAYGLAPSQVAANGSFLEGRTFRVSGALETVDGSVVLRGRSGGRVHLETPNTGLPNGVEAVATVRRSADHLSLLALHTYRGLTRHRVLWSLLPVPLIAFLFFREFRMGPKGLVRR